MSSGPLSKRAGPLSKRAGPLSKRPGPLFELIHFATVLVPSPLEYMSGLSMQPLPASLAVLGNAKAWRAVDLAQRTPVVLHGPPGCGKTEGVRALLAHHGIANCVHLDVTDPRSTAELRTLLRATRCPSNLHGKWALMIDAEGVFEYEDKAKALVEWLHQPGAQVPVFLCCNDLYSYPLRALRALVDAKKVAAVRLFAPFRSACVSFYKDRYPVDWILNATLDADNDLRQVASALEAREELGAAFDGEVDRSTHVYATLNGLARRVVDADEWVRQTDGGLDARAIHSNYPVLSHDIDQAAAMADALSAADALGYSERDSRAPAQGARDERAHLLAHSVAAHATPTATTKGFTLLKDQRAKDDAKPYDARAEGGSKIASYLVPRALGGLEM